MYTQVQYDQEFERYKNADLDTLKLVKWTFHHRFALTDQQDARIRAVSDLMKIRQKERATSRQRNRRRS